MAMNHEYMERVKIANAYKAQAVGYIWEAMSLYLEWKQETELTGKSKATSKPQPKSRFWEAFEFKAHRMQWQRRMEPQSMR